MLFIQQNILEAMDILWKKKTSKCWWWLATFFKNAGGERLKVRWILIGCQCFYHLSARNVF